MVPPGGSGGARDSRDRCSCDTGAGEASGRVGGTAEHAGRGDGVRQRNRELVATETFGERFVTKMLGRQLGLS